MKLSDKIIRMMYEFEGRSGQKPKAIYLGVKTRMDLFTEVESASAFYSGTTKIPRPEFNGLPIFLVDEEDYLNIG